MTKVALVSIDYQKGFDDPVWGQRNNPEAELKMQQLLRHWRKNAWPVIHVQHCSTEPNSPLIAGCEGNEFKPETQPIAGEMVFKKAVNSAFIGTDLKQYLHEFDIQSLVIAGLTTDHCVSTTVRMAANYGFKVLVVADATATFERTSADGVHYSAEQIHHVHLTRSLSENMSRSEGKLI